MTDLTSRDTESTSVSTAVGSNITADVANTQRNMLVFFALIMVLIGISFYLKPRDGTVVTEVATHAVRVEFRKSATTWELRPSVLCLYEKRRGKSQTAQPDSLCGNGPFKQVLLESKAVVVWPQGTRIKVRHARGTRGLSIIFEGLGKGQPIVNNHTLEERSFIRMAQEQWMQSGPLLIKKAYVKVGLSAAPGSTEYLVEGRYEFREKLMFSQAATLTLEGVFQPDNVDGRLTGRLRICRLTVVGNTLAECGECDFSTVKQVVQRDIVRCQGFDG